MKGDGSFISRASKQAKNEELLITKWSPALLNNELDKWLWQHSKHINTKQMWEYFASYPYLPRLKDSSVLTECIKEGLRSRDFFGYASDMDSSERYLGLEFGNPGVSVSLDPKSVLIKKEEALKQALEEDKQQKNEHGILEGLDKHHQTKSNKEILEESKATIFRRFYGRANLDPMRVSRDADQIADEVIQHLSALQASDVNISIEINAKVPSGIPEKTVKILLENCKTLKFNVNDFEE